MELVQSSFAALKPELERLDDHNAALPCVDDWTIKDLLAVRAWWTESVVSWIQAGQRGEIPETPAPGYRWRETPRLNAGIVDSAKNEPCQTLVRRLKQGYAQVMILIDGLSDQELLQPGEFEWAGSYPISRWISINTARQYTTARTYIRRALKQV